MQSEHPELVSRAIEGIVTSTYYVHLDIRAFAITTQVASPLTVERSSIARVK